MSEMKSYKGKNWKLYQGDCTKIIPKLKKNYFDSCVTDPPYNLASIVKRFGGKNAAKAKHGKDGSFSRLSKGFMSKVWDNEVAFDPKTWKIIYDALKPGAYLLAFGGERTEHKMTSAIEAAGFNIRHKIMYLYGSGFPKSVNVAKHIDKMIRGFPQGGSDPTSVNHGNYNPPKKVKSSSASAYIKNGKFTDRKLVKQARKWEGYGTALTPAYEPIVLAQKPIAEKTIAKNVLKWGTGGLNIDSSRIATNPAVDDKRLGGNGNWKTDKAGKNVYGLKFKDKISSSSLGRFPKNVIHSGDTEVMAEFARYGVKKSGKPGVRRKNHNTNSMAGTLNKTNRIEAGIGNSGSVARFFYSAKANKLDRAMSTHPTVKGQALMRYLVRLVTPKGGKILEPFSGSGSTLQAAISEGFKVVGIEQEKDYVKHIRKRMRLYKQGHLANVKAFKAYQASKK